MKTYNTELTFNTPQEQNFWLSILSFQQQLANQMYASMFNSKTKLNLKFFHDTLYKKLKNEFPLPSQIVIKTEQEVLAAFRSIKTNKHILEAPPVKKNLSLRLDKRLYSRFSKNSIFLTSSIPNKRTEVKLNLYPAIEELFNSYTTADPLIFYKNNKFYLSVSFDIPNKPVINEKFLGIDLGLKRLFTTSDGTALSGKEYNKYKRKVRYLKRQLQSKNTQSAKKHLKKLSKKEYNFSKNYIHQATNKLLETDKTVLVLEDLTKIKAKNKGRRFNNRLSQMPFFLLKQILIYKALHIGKRVETVNPAYTSQIDCLTNQKDGKRQGCRYYSSTGIILDADWNAAINIACRKHPTSFSVPKDGTLNFVGRLLSINQTLKII